MYLVSSRLSKPFFQSHRGQTGVFRPYFSHFKCTAAIKFAFVSTGSQRDQETQRLKVMKVFWKLKRDLCRGE